MSCALTFGFRCSLTAAVFWPGGVIGIVDRCILLTTDALLIEPSSCVGSCETSQSLPLRLSILHANIGVSIVLGFKRCSSYTTADLWTEELVFELFHRPR